MIHDKINKFTLEKTDKELPSVLLIGDSIVSGYTATVRSELSEIAITDFWVTGMHENCPDLHKELEEHTKARKYTMIHFNIGLHGWPEGRIPEGQYENLMKKYVNVIKASAPQAVLVWASTTPVTELGNPEKLNEMINPIIVDRNRMALEIMKSHGIVVNDLYAFMINKLKYKLEDRFHWNSEGKVLQGKEVARFIKNILLGGAG